MGKQWKQWQTLFSWVPKLLQMVTATMKLKDAWSLEEKLYLPRQHIEKHRRYFVNKGPSSWGYGFSSSQYRCENWIIKKAEHQRIDAFEMWCWGRCLQSPLDSEEIQPVHPKGDQSWVFTGRTDAGWNSNTLATWCEELTHLKRPWCWEGLKAGGEGDNRGWDGWMASPIQWTWVWVNSRSWWWTGKPGVLQSMGSQRVGDDWVNWTELNWKKYKNPTMWSGISQTRKTTYCRYHVWKMSRTGTSLRTESPPAVSRGWESGAGAYLLLGTGLRMGRWKSSGTR